MSSTHTSKILLTKTHGGKVNKTLSPLFFRGIAMDNTKRFDNKGEIYAKARPKYSQNGTLTVPTDTVAYIGK